MAEITEKPVKDNVKKFKLMRCLDWLQEQDNQEPKKLSLQNKNDIQFIIRTNAERKNFLLSAAEDEATVPAGVVEPEVEPKPVPRHKLRVELLRLECEWPSCRWFCGDYSEFQKHVRGHLSDVHIIDNDGKVDYVCLWDVCGHKTSDFQEMVRHISYHAYHSRLLAIGFNGRASLKLERCKKDSKHRNRLPPLTSDHCCMWTECQEKFDSIQRLFDHMRVHVSCAEQRPDRFLCSWAGCGLAVQRRAMLTVHVRSHTGERVIACYHCGRHFANNRKLCDHLRRQNVNPNSSFKCAVCGAVSATEYLLQQHTRQHVSEHACSLCDVSAPTLAALAQHVRYRHLTGPEGRPHACPHCSYRAITRYDLRKHILTHKRKRKNGSKAKGGCEPEPSEDESEAEASKAPKPRGPRQYVCHMCSGGKAKVFRRGTRLTTHLIQVHGAQLPFGHSRFRYQLSDDGMYRLTTTRFEILEVSKKIVDGYSGPKGSINTSFEFKIEQKAEATETTPRRYEITLKNNSSTGNEDTATEGAGSAVEITMCDLDEKGQIIKSETIKSGVMFT